MGGFYLDEAMELVRRMFPKAIVTPHRGYSDRCPAAIVIYCTSRGKQHEVGSTPQDGLLEADGYHAFALDILTKLLAFRLDLEGEINLKDAESIVASVSE